MKTPVRPYDGRTRDFTALVLLPDYVIGAVQAPVWRAFVTVPVRATLGLELADAKQAAIDDVYEGMDRRRQVVNKVDFKVVSIMGGFVQELINFEGD